MKFVALLMVLVFSCSLKTWSQSKIIEKLLISAKNKDFYKFSETAKLYGFKNSLSEKMQNGSIKYFYSKNIYVEATRNYRCKPEEQLTYRDNPDKSTMISIETTSLDFYNVLLKEIDSLNFKQMSISSDYSSSSEPKLKIQIKRMAIVTEGCEGEHEVLAIYIIREK